MRAASQVDVMRTRLRDDGRGAVGTERIAVWIVAILAVAGVVTLVVQPGVIAASPPDAAFEGRYDAETNTFQLIHDSGDVIERGPTTSVVVVVEDAESDATHNVTWVAGGDDGVGSYPVEPGSSLLIDDATVDANDDGSTFDADATVGFELGGGDTATVVWRGRPMGAPGNATVTLDTVTIPSQE